MKKILSILCALVLLCLSVFPVCAATPKISVKTVSSASVGDTITVSVNLSANSGLAGIQFQVKFNTAEFQLVSNSVKTGNLFFGEEITNAGLIEYAGVSSDKINASGALLTFKLKVLKTGGKITLVVNDAIDENDKFVAVSTANATVKCSHANIKWETIKKATCTEKGEKKGACTCGYNTTEIIEKSSHTYDKWTTEKEPTETEKGLKWAKCTVCGEKKEQAIPVITTTTTTTETTTETTTFVELTTEPTTKEETTVPAPQIVEKTSTVEIVVKTVAVVLGVEALGLIVFLIGKKRINNTQKGEE